MLKQTVPMILKTIVIDDEEPSRDTLIKSIHDYCDNVEVVASCGSVKTGYSEIIRHNPHLVFLDIEMPNSTGFDLLKMFNTISFKVIFITAYAKYAIKAFRFSATDYLLKPVMADELVEAVNKVRSEISREISNLNLQKLMENLSDRTGDYRQLVISDSNGFRIVETADIILCEADGYCTHFLLSNNEKITSSKNLKQFDDLLNNQGFIRVHNSFMVNILHIRSYSNQGEIQLSQNFHCPLGNAYKQKFLERFKKHR